MLKRVTNAFAILVFCSIFFFYTSLLSTVLLFNTYLNPIPYFQHRIVSFCKTFFHHLLSTVFQRWFPRPIFIKYDNRILEANRTIVISNHCSDYDWIILFTMLYSFGKNDTFKLLMKRSLERIPFVGHILRASGHIFLNRQRNVDTAIIKRSVQSVVKNSKYHIGIYPEGTYLFKDAMEHAKNYAKTTNLRVDNSAYIPDRALIPRKLGFKIIETAAKSTYEGVIDITVMMNPYIYMPWEECSAYDFFLNQKLIMNQCLILDFVPKSEVEKSGDEFLIKRFKLKEESIYKYAECVEKGIETEEEFKNVVQNIGGLDDAQYSIATLYVNSRYSPLIMVFPVLLILFIILRYNGI